jgi:hypothetical protein
METPVKNMLITSLTRDSKSSNVSFQMGDEKRLVNQMSDNTDQRRLNDTNEMIEEQIDLLLPELCFLFRIAGIPVKRSDSKYANIVVFVFMWVIDILMIGVYLKKVHEDKNPHFSHLVEVYWALHSCIIYSLLSHAMHNNAQIFQTILLSAQSEINEWRSSMQSNYSIDGMDTTTTATQKSLRKHSKICVYITIFSVAFNVIMLISTRFDQFLYRHLPWTDSIFFNLMGVVAWYFYSFYWFMAIICVYLPVHFFSMKVKLYMRYVENGLSGLHREEVIKAMEWYDDLYKVNKLMNFESLSLLATTTLLMLMLLLIGLLLSIVKDGDIDIKGPTLFWITTNSVVIACIAYTVAELETANKK